MRDRRLRDKQKSHQGAMMAFVLSKLVSRQAAFVTLLDFKQLVQTVIRRGLPFTFARTS
jgi:hypothetical protein